MTSSSEETGPGSPSFVSITRSATVSATPQAVWALIGGFCSLKEWHPAIGECTQTGPDEAPVRTLVTKGGTTTFVEAQTARTPFSYSYAILSSPLPLTDYRSTLSVAAAASGSDEVTWASRFTPGTGQEQAAEAAVAGIYDPGLTALKSRFGG